MNISEEHIARVGALGYTPDEARFLYTVATFSGYFVPRQFIGLFDSKRRWDHFIGKLESRGHATWRKYQGAGGVYHLFSKTLYRAIDKEHLPNHRRHASDFIRTRLVLLDFVLTNQSFTYLETENDRVSYFCQTLGVPQTALPVRTFPGGSGRRLRHFVDRFPVFLDELNASSPLTLCYVDAGDASIARFARHLGAYQRLLANLIHFRFLYVSNSAVNFAAAERIFGAFANRALRDDPSAELIHYFTLRDRWDNKQYGKFSPEDLEWLHNANFRLRSPGTERLYSEWRTGEISGADLGTRIAGTRRAPTYCFSPWLVSPKTNKELEKAG